MTSQHELVSVERMMLLMAQLAKLCALSLDAAHMDPLLDFAPTVGGRRDRAAARPFDEHGFV